MTVPAPADEVTSSGRRQRLRRDAIVQIKQAALEQVRLVGAADVSLRAVARGAGMSPAGLYRYYDGRDAILTALIADAFDRLAAVMAAAVDQAIGPVEQVVAVARAYRRWGVTNPHEFGLVFGNPVPGYAAPVGGETSQAMEGVGQALFRPVVELWMQDRLDLPPPFDATPWTAAVAGLASQIQQLVAGLDGETDEDDRPPPRPITPALAGFLLSVWGRLHGMVSLEVFGQFDWLYPDGADDLFEADLASLVATLH